MWWTRTPKLPLGARGERLAARYLWLRGYTILERNLRLGKNEIDLLARKGDTVVFVEVKTRLRSEASAPEDSVGPTKQQHIRNAARVYLAKQETPGTYYRFDVISVVVPDTGKAQITHFPDAFR